VLTVQYKVGEPRIDSLVKLYDTLMSNRDWLPANLGVLDPVVKPKGIDDVPIVALTLHSTRDEVTAADLQRVAHELETELKRVPGTREVSTLGGPGDLVRVTLDPERMNAHHITVTDVERALRAAAEGADYVAFGSFYPSPTKPAAQRASLELLREARQRLRVPIVAIGGITPENGGALVAAGADALAVIQGLFAQTDVRAAARRYAALFASPLP